MVLTARAAELHALMPLKPPADLSKFLISPMPGLLTEVAVASGQEIKAGEKLAVIEAMKMENVLRADATPWSRNPGHAGCLGRRGRGADRFRVSAAPGSELEQASAMAHDHDRDTGGPVMKLPLRRLPVRRRPLSDQRRAGHADCATVGCAALARGSGRGVAGKRGVRLDQVNPPSIARQSRALVLPGLWDSARLPRDREPDHLDVTLASSTIHRRSAPATHLDRSRIAGSVLRMTCRGTRAWPERLRLMPGPVAGVRGTNQLSFRLRKSWASCRARAKPLVQHIEPRDAIEPEQRSPGTARTTPRAPGRTVKDSAAAAPCARCRVPRRRGSEMHQSGAAAPGAARSDRP
jgi:hypothetical protein